VVKSRLEDRSHNPRFIDIPIHDGRYNGE